MPREEAFFYRLGEFFVLSGGAGAGCRPGDLPRIEAVRVLGDVVPRLNEAQFYFRVRPGTTSWRATATFSDAITLGLNNSMAVLRTDLDGIIQRILPAAHAQSAVCRTCRT